MQRARTWTAVLAVIAACGPEAPQDVGQRDTQSGLLAQSSRAAIVGMTSALSSPAQRHLVRVQPPNHAPVHLMAVQNDGYTYERAGLLWYRSDDGGATWRYYKDIIAQPDPAVFNSSRRPTTLHLTADLIVVGSDIVAVYSHDATSSSAPADVWDPQCVVYFQWWRFDGVNDWIPGQRLTVASPSSGQAYRRAGLARDSAGRLWVQAFLRRSSCNPVGSASCTGDMLQVWVSTDGGSSFQGPQNLAALPNQLGGGRLISVGSQLLMLWGDYSTKPAQLMRRNDSEPLTQWSAKVNAFPDGAHIYHGASLSAVDDGAGGLHLVHKKWVAADTHQLYYRHFDGLAFGPAIALGSLGDWATQPAITSVGDDLYICVNHLISTNTNYEMRTYRLSNGFTAWDAIDTQVNAKAYPSAPERVPSSDRVIPCAFGMGNNSTDFWGAGHTVQVAQQPVGSTSTPAAAPTFSPAPGTYPSPQTVSLSSATAGATIFYTTDGTTPTSASPRYTGPFTVSVTTTVRALATATGFTNSPIASGTYTIQSQTSAAATPTFSPAPGTYPSPQTVSLSSATAGATIFYTTDGTTPTSASPRYTGPFTVSVTTTVRALATATGFMNSPVASGAFTIQSPPAGTLFSDEFARSSGLGASWRTWYGSYSTDGSKANSGSPPVQGNWASIVPPLGTGNYAVEATLSIPSGARYSGVVARSSGSDFTRDLYSAQISSTGAVTLYRRNAWTWTLLRSASAAVQTNRFYTVQLVTTGVSPVHVEVWLDGATLITYDDTSAGRLTSGAVGVENYDAGVQYESFRVLAR
jgi:hypothetical protein